jgi:hypothetical protein
MPVFDDAESQKSYEARRTTPPPLPDPNRERSRLEWLALPVGLQPYPFDANLQEFKDWFKQKYGKDATF